MWGKSKIVISSYLWMILVPIAANIAYYINSALTFPFWKQGIGLPISWKFFYFASIFFSISNILFSWKCPFIIKNNKTFSDFFESGKGQEHLREYFIDFINTSRVFQKNQKLDFNNIRNILIKYSNNIDSIPPMLNSEKSKSILKKETIIEYINKSSFQDDSIKNVFWELWYLHDNCRYITRFLCTFFYFIGSMCIIAVVCINVYRILVV
jgi:hypothetical protein